MSWEYKKFIDFILLQRGHDLTKAQIVPGGYLVVTSTAIMGYHNAFKAKGPGVITGRSGTIGEVQYIEENYWPHNTSLYVKDFRGNNPKFVYYFIKNFGTGRAKSGSAVPTLNRNNLSGIDIFVPDIDTQDRIADYLSAFDDLIENNRKQIKLLEEVAQRLYKEWFVDLRFPGYEDTQIVDDMPEGWKKDTIDSRIKLLSGYAFKSAEFNDAGKYKIVTIKNVKDGEFDGDNVSRIIDIPSKMPEHCKLNDGDVLLSLTGNVGRVCIVNGKDFLLNQRVAKLESKIPAYAYCLFRSKDMFDEMNNLANGAAQQNLSPIRTGKIVIAYPTDDLLKQFENMVEPIIFKMMILNKENIVLAEARNRLLPKLMNGEIEV